MAVLCSNCRIDLEDDRFQFSIKDLIKFTPRHSFLEKYRHRIDVILFHKRTWGRPLLTGLASHSLKDITGLFLK